MCAAAGATARAGSAVPAPAADTVMLSEATDGDYIVRRFLVKRQGDTDYSIRYQINLASLSAALDGNSRELDGLNAFVDNLMRDTLMHVKSVEITGYSSPDGPRAFNETLARNRAQDFKSYVDKKYGFSKKYDVTLNSVAEDWEMCRALVAQSPVPDKQAVLGILDGKQSSDAKELALKKIPAAWEYMIKHILQILFGTDIIFIFLPILRFLFLCFFYFFFFKRKLFQQVCYLAIDLCQFIIKERKCIVIRF